MFEGRPNRSAEIVMVGRSNVGKSTIMRLLTGHAVPTGRKPGVTRQPNHFGWAGPDFLLTDLPGFGFMSGVPGEVREEIKTDIVHYLEANADAIVVAILVLDGKSAVEIIDRHSGRGELPHDVELFSFLQELDIPTVVAVNKMDKVPDRDDRMDDIAERLGLPTPWQQWRDVLVPMSAKREQIEPLREAIGTHLREQGKGELRGCFA